MYIIKSRAVSAILASSTATAHLIARQSRSEIDRQQREEFQRFHSISVGAIIAVVISLLFTVAVMATITIMLVKRRNRRRNANAAMTAAGTYSYGNGGYNEPYTSIPNGAQTAASPADSNNMYAPAGGATAGYGQHQHQKHTGSGADPAVVVESYRPTGQVPV